MMASRDNTDKNLSPFRVLSCDRVGENRSHDVMIPLKDIFGIAQSTAYSTDIYGNTKISLELDISKLNSAWSLGISDPIWPKEPIVGSGEYGKMNDIAPVGTTDGTSIFTTKIDYLQETWRNESPFWVNQRLKITITIDANAPVVYTKTVTQVGFNSGNDDVFIHVDSGCVTVPDGSTAVITVTGDDPADLELTVNSAELIAEIVEDTNPPNTHEFLTVSTESDHGNGVFHHSKNYIVEPECVNLVVALPGGALHERTVSSLAYDDYRITVNNINQTSKAIARMSPLFLDRVSRYMLNHAKPVGNLLQRKPALVILPGGGDYNLISNGIFEPMPITPNSKIVGLNINTSGTAVINEIVLYKELIKSI